MVSPNSVGPDVKVKGTTVCLVADGLTDLSERAEAKGSDLLSEAGFSDPDPDAWYSLRKWIAVLEEIGESVSHDALRHLGTKLPERVEWPSDVDSTRLGFDTVNEAYQMNHRGGDIGYYEFIETDERERTVVCENPYPCPFDEGIIEGVLRVFGYEFSYPPMVFIHETGDQCRMDGGERCEYRVTW